MVSLLEQRLRRAKRFVLRTSLSSRHAAKYHPPPVFQCNSILIVFFLCFHLATTLSAELARIFAGQNVCLAALTSPNLRLPGPISNYRVQISAEQPQLLLSRCPLHSGDFDKKVLQNMSEKKHQNTPGEVRENPPPRKPKRRWSEKCPTRKKRVNTPKYLRLENGSRQNAPKLRPKSTTQSPVSPEHVWDRKARTKNPSDDCMVKIKARKSQGHVPPKKARFGRVMSMRLAIGPPHTNHVRSCSSNTMLGARLARAPTPPP